MDKKTKQFHPDEWLKDLPSEPEVQKFSTDEMIGCEKCGRKSPPTRLKCLYCGETLTISLEQSAHLKPNLRKLDDWEKGYNLIWQPRKGLENSGKLAENAALLHLEKDDVQKIFNSQMSLPLARAETRIEAEAIAKQLKSLEIDCKIISDEELQTDKFPRRLRGIEFDDDKLIFIHFNADEVVQIGFADLSLIVVGAVFERKIEASESIKKKDDRKILEMAEVSNDEVIIDVYTREDSIGYRIESKGFDFSCLGSEKGLFAKDNMPKLAEKLRSSSLDSKFNNDYLKLREEIGKVWGVSERSESGGLQRKGMLGVKRTNITTISNLSQFTRFSRLQWHNL